MVLFKLYFIIIFDIERIKLSFYYNKINKK